VGSGFAIEKGNSPSCSVQTEPAERKKNERSGRRRGGWGVLTVSGLAYRKTGVFRGGEWVGRKRGGAYGNRGRDEQVEKGEGASYQKKSRL